MSTAISSFFSNLVPASMVVHADEPESAKVEVEEEVSSKRDESGGEGEGEGEAQEVQEEEEEEPEEEEEEPEDIMPALKEECQNSAKCAQLTKHFQHCEEKVSSGKGFKGEDCVEELFHMMHCVDNCVAPKLFSKLQ